MTLPETTMEHFRLIRDDIDIEPVRQELAARDAAWLAQTGRQARAVAQQHTQSIPLRGLRRSRTLGRRRRDVLESRDTSLVAEFPHTRALLDRLAQELGGPLGRAKLARLPPGRTVLPHVDRGEYYLAHDRYHLVITSPHGSVLSAGGETARLAEGELWWFDNKALHHAANPSPDHRVHLIFDVAVEHPPSAFGAAAARPGPAELYRAARARQERHMVEEVAEAVRVYAAACADPEQWGEVLRANGRQQEAETAPIAVLCELYWPGLRKRDRRRCESAVAWSLAQLDLGRITLEGVDEAILGAGGLDTLHAAWRASAQSMLYEED